MRYSLLEMVQMLLSALDSDEVNSISDTVESNQVALIIKGVYYDRATDISLTEHETLFQLNASGDIDKPCVMTLPDHVVTMRDLRYNIQETGEAQPNYRTIQYVPFNEFLDRMRQVEGDTDIDVQNIEFNNELFPFNYYTNRWPTIYTTADDRQLIFDAVKLSEDTTLVKSKTMCMGNVYPEFQMVDNFVPDLDPSQFSLLINNAKVRAFNELKQVINQEAVAEARRQKVIVQKRKRSTPDQAEIYKAPRYGRK